MQMIPRDRKKTFAWSKQIFAWFKTKLFPRERMKRKGVTGQQLDWQEGGHSFEQKIHFSST